MPTVLKKIWIPVVVVVAIALGGVAVVQLRDAFGSEVIFTATGGTAKPLAPTYVKRVTYEIYGPGDTAGSVSYLNQNAQPEQASFTRLPWTYTITTTVSAVLANVVAQGNSNNIGCRITVNDQVRDQQAATGRHAQTSCLVKAA
ncbi:MmpS family transport accessory protein [Mycobacterium sp. OTB74]|uniref:MmpS family transport accessory protein n=1 Tax=Mycobacterium sp. OTB74 TaxID=1853452 RepID=UPI002474949B|nr:MmpS family transport accessory protein [Mycobacterium sp. OTB74]MDH6245814.1 hypothetical protein [Mycobacterium sp. OTB74]